MKKGEGSFQASIQRKATLSHLQLYVPRHCPQTQKVDTLTCTLYVRPICILVFFSIFAFPFHHKTLHVKSHLPHLLSHLLLSFWFFLLQRYDSLLYLFITIYLFFLYVWLPIQHLPLSFTEYKPLPVILALKIPCHCLALAMQMILYIFIVLSGIWIEKQRLEK